MRSRCGAVYTVENGQLTGVQPDPDHPTGGALCAKGRALPEILHHPDRLRKPLRRSAPKDSLDPGWVEIGWDEALDTIAARMRGVRDRHGPEAVAFCTTTPSGSAISDSLDWILRFVWQFGSPNLIASVEVCNFQKDYGQALTFGQPLGVPDYDRADTIILWGHNPVRTWLAQAQRIAEARQRGARVVVIDPKRAGSGEQADLWLRIHPGTDAILAMGAIRHLLTTGRFASDFVRDWTDAAFLIDRETGNRLDAAEVAGASGFVFRRQNGRIDTFDPVTDAGLPGDIDLFFEGVLTDRARRQRRVSTALAQLRENSLPWDPSTVSRETGIAMQDLAAFFELVASSPRMAYYHWTGFAQGPCATQTTRAVSALFALRDDIDAEGGNRWLNAPPVLRIADPKELSDDRRARALALDQLPLGPPRHGFSTLRDVCEAVEVRGKARVRMLFAFGSNLLLSHPDAERTRHAFQKLDFHVHCDLFMTPTAELADIVLPVAGPLEHDTIRCGFEISEHAAGHVQFRPALLPPPGDARPDHWIARSLAIRLGFEDNLWSLPLETALDQVLAPVGLDVAALRARPEGIALPVKQTPRAYAETSDNGQKRGFDTPSRRIEFHSSLLHAEGYPPVATASYPPPRDPDFPVRATTAKSGYYTHSSLRNITSLRRRAPYPTVEISPSLAKRHRLIENDWAVVTTEKGSVRLKVQIDPEMDDHVAIVAFGWWQGCDPLSAGARPVIGEGSSNINAILSDSVRDPVSGAPPLRSFSCAIRRDDDASRGNWAGERSFSIDTHKVIGNNVLCLGLRPVDGKPLPRFLPGQHIGISVHGVEGQRYYSLITDGRPTDRWELAIRRGTEAEGSDRISISCHLHDIVSAGDKLLVTPPTGSFVIPVGGARPVICIAGGIGVTPFVSAFRAAAAEPEARLSDTPVHLHYLCTHPGSAVFHEELAALAAGHRHLSFDLWLKQGPQSEVPWLHSGWSVPHIAGSIDPALLEMRPLVYLCGPAGLMDAFRTELTALGVPSGDILSEAFRSAFSLPENMSPARIVLARSGQGFVWEPKAGSILSAAFAAGIALPSGCQAGQCESCAVTVIAGEFYCSASNELESTRCLTCQSVPLGDMVLDL
ncbi:MAG: molybdopterin-dependent oxidoreductase [Rhodobacteraceae bacterium]|nr:molybdopterin-dependent oxidoreductase [Paracoccaceae bacterium]